LQSNNEQLLRDAQLERDALLKSAREAKEMIVSEARTKATEEAERIISIAREAIKNEKMAAITELKNQVAILSLEIAEKLVKQNLSSDENQKELSNKLIADLRLN
jgi:F-type H+-transporting ATPase subunit b